MPATPDHSIDLQELIDHARRNERIARTLFDIEVEVMNLSDTTSFLDKLTDLVRTRFGLDHVWLALTDIENNERLCAALSEQGAQVKIHRVPTVDFMRLVGWCLEAIIPGAINQAWRHSFWSNCGDAYLCFIADQFQSLLREGDSVFRFAGDEFVVLLPNQDLESATRIGLRFTTHFENVHFEWQGRQLEASFSWGAASSQEAGQDAADSLLRAADQRLYEDKRKRKTRASDYC